MKRHCSLKMAFIITLLIPLALSAQSINWPILKRYDSRHLSKIALPVGGIGTGTVSISGRGELIDWEIMNRPAKGFSAGQTGNGAPFFSIYTFDGRQKKTKALMGPLEFSEYQDKEGRPVNNHGLPRFRNVFFETAYPLAQVVLSDKTMPVKVRLKAFNPLIPANADDSGIPVAVLTYEVTNTSNKKIDASICGLMRNFIGMDGYTTIRNWKYDVVPTGAKNNKNAFKSEDGISGIYMTSEGVDKNSEAYGTIALTTNSNFKITYRTSSTPNDWENALLDFWDDFGADGELVEKDKSYDHDPQASLAVKFQLKPGETKNIPFFITWHFPNRKGWSQQVVGNYYCTQYENAWDVIKKTAPRIKSLEEKTVEFVEAFCSSPLPLQVKEAALFNLSTLRSQTVFRTPDGLMYGWEGVMDYVGSCYGNCTHVWNYEQATPFLFGDLAKNLRKVEFNYATDDSGLMSFRVGLPIDKNAKGMNAAAADGQMGTIMKMYRDWQLSGDNDFLKELFPKVKKAIEFCWLKGGWDGNEDGVMEGVQHNTMDVEYYGPNPQMQIWYLGALKAMTEMASYMNDRPLAEKCLRLFNSGSAWTDKHLFNGEYYEQIIQTPKSLDEPLKGTCVSGTVYLTNPPYQLGKGCLVDQLVGQFMSHVCGLGYLVKKENIVQTLNSIMKYNYRSTMIDHFNNMRSYALGNESALLMASFPKERPQIPFPYFSEVMTGFEYTAAIGMLYEGLTKDGLKCIGNIRDRYDGLKRSPFDEAECGHHYARAMISWASVTAMNGFHYSGVKNLFAFNKKEGTCFWSTGYAYGTITQKTAGGKLICDIKVLGGSIKLDKIILNGYGVTILKNTAVLKEKEKFSFTADKSAVSDFSTLVKI